MANDQPDGLPDHATPCALGPLGGHEPYSGRGPRVVAPGRPAPVKNFYPERSAATASRAASSDVGGWRAGTPVVGRSERRLARERRAGREEVAQ